MGLPRFELGSSAPETEVLTKLNYNPSFLQKVMNPVCINPNVLGLIVLSVCHSLTMFSTVLISEYFNFLRTFATDERWSTVGE